MLNFLKGSNFRKANNYYMSTGSMKLLAFITAGFILSIALNLHATVSVYVVPPLNRARILPDTVLPSSWLSNNLFLIACKGEYEPGSFVVCSDSTANSISVSVSNLTGSGGTIPAANVDIRVVKCWYQAGYRINDLSHKHLTGVEQYGDIVAINV